MGSPFKQYITDPTAVPDVLVQLYFKKLPVVTHVFSAETGLAKHTLLTHTQRCFRAVTTLNAHYRLNEVSRKEDKKILNGTGSSQLHPVQQSEQVHKVSQLFIVSPKSHKRSEVTRVT